MNQAVMQQETPSGVSVVVPISVQLRREAGAEVPDHRGITVMYKDLRTGSARPGVNYDEIEPGTLKFTGQS